MSAALQAGAVTCTALGLLCATAVLLRTRDVRLAVQVLVDLLLAAGLLRLTGDPGWGAVAAAALLVLLRRVVR